MRGGGGCGLSAHLRDALGVAGVDRAARQLEERRGCAVAQQRVAQAGAVAREVAEGAGGVGARLGLGLPYEEGGWSPVRREGNAR